VPILWSEYFPNKFKKDGKTPNNSQWDTKPFNQLRKCAEAASLRSGFDDILQGWGIPEEFDRDAKEGVGSEETAVLVDLQDIKSYTELQAYKEEHDTLYQRHKWFREAYHERAEVLRNIIVQDSTGADSQEVPA
jgi:hypothetical protein